MFDQRVIDRFLYKIHSIHQLTKILNYCSTKWRLFLLTLKQISLSTWVLLFSNSSRILCSRRVIQNVTIRLLFFVPFTDTMSQTLQSCKNRRFNVGEFEFECIGFKKVYPSDDWFPKPELLIFLAIKTGNIPTGSIPNDKIINTEPWYTTFSRVANCCKKSYQLLIFIDNINNCIYFKQTRLSIIM